jgi:hypothetical protein
MITITEDPGVVIPNIQEKYIDNKIILVHVLTDRENLVGVAIKSNYSNEFSWRGAHIHYSTSCTNWDLTWSASSLIELLIKTWKNIPYMSNIRTTDIYIIENMIELESILLELDVKNSELEYDITNKARIIWKLD